VTSGGRFRQPGAPPNSGSRSGGAAGGASAAATASNAAPGSWAYDGGETRLVRPGLSARLPALLSSACLASACLLAVATVLQQLPSLPLTCVQVSLPDGCSLAELLAVLGSKKQRGSGGASGGGGGGGGGTPTPALNNSSLTASPQEGSSGGERGPAARGVSPAELGPPPSIAGTATTGSLARAAEALAAAGGVPPEGLAKVRFLLPAQLTAYSLL
jgi:hypothetical protein